MFTDAGVKVATPADTGATYSPIILSSHPPVRWRVVPDHLQGARMILFQLLQSPLKKSIIRSSIRKRLRKTRYRPTAPMMAIWLAARSSPRMAASCASSFTCLVS